MSMEEVEKRLNSELKEMEENSKVGGFVALLTAVLFICTILSDALITQ